MPEMAPRTWFPEVLHGRLVTLRRHAPENLAAFRRWYADPEIARLARYQQTAMRPEEIERFFASRAVGCVAPRIGSPMPTTGSFSNAITQARRAASGLR